MSRYFKVELTELAAIRSQVMGHLEQPNEKAHEPWPVNGDSNDGAYGYVALGTHHSTGEFAELIAQFIELPGVAEITREDYLSAVPPSS